MNRFLYKDENENLYDIDFNTVDKDRNILEIINTNGFTKDQMVPDKRAIGMRVIGARSIYEDAVVLIMIGDKKLSNIHFKEPMKSLFSVDNKKWVKFYDFNTYNYDASATITNMDSSNMSDLDIKNYNVLKKAVDSVKYNNTVECMDFKFIWTRLNSGQCLNAVYELVKTSSHEIQIRPSMRIEPDCIKITINKDIDNLRVNITNSNHRIKDSLKEF